ncbi:MAG: hypothetical protein J0M04_11095 [Verrucomicrobia bacterium]|nr:hypothetical protein [Verrucomicrobiota bacterium]
MKNLPILALSAFFLTNMPMFADSPAQPVVGDLGSVAKIRFHGNQTFSTEILRGELARSCERALASGRDMPLDPLVAATRDLLRSGYLGTGFPDVEVSVKVVPDGSGLLATIKEGPRFRMGEIRNDGGDEALFAKIREAMMTRPVPNPTHELARQIRKLAEGLAKNLPPAEQVKISMEQTARNGMLEPDDTKEPKIGWVPGDPVEFPDDDGNPYASELAGRLILLGKPLARIQSHLERMPDGSADLIVRVEDPGPNAVIGDTTVLGCFKSTEAAIIAAAGLATGKPFTPNTLDRATVALWNTGRFHPFDIAPRERENQPGTVDLTIRVVETVGVPDLETPLPPEQEAGRKFAAAFNSWIAGEKFKDFMASGKTPEGGSWKLGISGSDGVYFEMRQTKDAPRQAFAYGKDALWCDITLDGRRSTLKMPVLTIGCANIALTPSPDNDGRMDVGFGLGVSSSQGKRLTPVEILVAPAIAPLKPKMFSLEKGKVVVRTEAGAILCYLDTARGELTDGPGFQIESRAGIVAASQKKLAAEIASQAEGITSDPGVIVRAVAKIMGGPGDDADSAELDTMLGLAGLALRLDSYASSWDKLMALCGANGEKTDLDISDDPVSFGKAGSVFALGTVFGGLAAADMLPPPDSWVAKLGREALYVMGGHTGGTYQAMETLANDPDIGPLGCLLAYQVFSRYNEAEARRFLVLGRKRADPAGFRRDRDVFLKPGSPIGRLVEHMLTEVAEMEPETERQVLEMLKSGGADAFKVVLARLRERPADRPPLHEWLAPTLDSLWEKEWQPAILGSYDSMLKPECDPATVAATVNGIPVSRILVGECERDGLLGRLPCGDAAPDPKRPWTRSPALAAAVRYTLLDRIAAPRNLPLRKGWLETTAQAKFPHLAGRPDADWLRETGMTRAQALEIIGRSELRDLAIKWLDAAVPRPDRKTVEAYYAEHGRDLARRAGLRSVVAKCPADQPAARGKGIRLVSATAKAVSEGLPLSLMKAAAEADSKAGLALPDMTHDFQLIKQTPNYGMLLCRLKPGESVITTEAQGVISLTVNSWTDAEPPPFSEVADKATAWCWMQQRRDLFESWIRQWEGTSEIVVLDSPADATPVAVPSPFAERLKADPYGALGRLGVFWELALARDPKAEAAFGKVADSGIAEVPAMVELADELLARDLADLAKICLDEARLQSPTDARKAVSAALERHRAKGVRGKQDQLEKLAAP